jgi:hypothetical protein
MASETLVDEQIEMGYTAIRKLREAGVDVCVAAWVKLGDELGWRLVIGLKAVDEEGLQPTYMRVFQLLGPEDANFNLKLVSDKSPIAKDLVRVREKYPAPLPTRYQGRQLGPMPIEEAYIYPIQPDVEKPKTDQIKSFLDQLVQIVEKQSRVSVITRGESIEGIMVGVDFAKDGAFLRLIDKSSQEQRVIPFHDIITMIEYEKE